MESFVVNSGCESRLIMSKYCSKFLKLAPRRQSNLNSFRTLQDGREQRAEEVRLKKRSKLRNGKWRRMERAGWRWKMKAALGDGRALKMEVLPNLVLTLALLAIGKWIGENGQNWKFWDLTWECFFKFTMNHTIVKKLICKIHFNLLYPAKCPS